MLSAGHAHARGAGDGGVAAGGVVLDGVGVVQAAGVGAARGTLGQQVPAYPRGRRGGRAFAPPTQAVRAVCTRG
jgi:hypothetical protein